MKIKQLGIFRSVARESLLFSIFLLLILVAVLSYSAYSKYQDYSATEQSKANTDFIANATSLLHAIQKERGMVASYLASHGHDFKESLDGQFEATDKKLDHATNSLTLLDSEEQEPLIKHYKKIISDIKGLRSYRQSVKSQAVTPGDAMKNYSALVVKQEKLFFGVINSTRDYDIKRLLEQFNRVQKKLEIAAKQRDDLSIVLDTGRFEKGLFREIVSLAAMEKAYDKQFIQYATPLELEEYQRITHSQSYVKATAIERELLAHDGELDAGHISGTKWFAIQTAKLDKIANLEKLLREEAGEIAHLHESADLKTLVLDLVLLLIALGLGTKITTSVVKKTARRISSLTDYLHQVANGELDFLVEEEESQDEMGDLLRSVNILKDNLSDSMLRINRGADVVSSSIKQIAKGNMDLSVRTESQASSLAQTAASMEELSATVKETAEQAVRARELSEDAKKVASEGGKIVAKSVESMEGVNTSSKKIADIIGVIDEIAFQTNLLALNAAVEAARAGEQGRGFAVVAGEVRSLAQRSASSAKEISSLIQDSVGNVKKGASSVQESGKSLDSIITSINNVANIIVQIAEASSQQSLGINEVNTAISEMDSITQQNSALVEEAAAASQELENQQMDIVAEVSKFSFSADNEQ